MAAQGVQDSFVAAISTITGTPAFKEFTLPLSGLNITKRVVDEFIRLCVANNLIELPEMYLRRQEMNGLMAIHSAGSEQDVSKYVSAASELSASPSSSRLGSRQGSRNMLSAGYSSQAGTPFSATNRSARYFGGADKRSEGLTQLALPTVSEGMETDTPPSDEEWNTFYQILCEVIDVSIECDDERIQSALTVPLAPSSPLDSSPNPEIFTRDPTNIFVSLPIDFNPSETIPRTRASIVLTRLPIAGGGRWRYSLTLASTQPPDVVEQGPLLTALVGQQSVGVIEVFSPQHKNCPFHATFKSGLIAEFALGQRDGEFDDEGRLRLRVSFHPTRYAGTRTAIISLTSESKQWLFSVKGELPPYEAPTGSSKVNSFRTGK